MEKLITRIRSLLWAGASLSDAHDCLVGVDCSEEQFFLAYHAARCLMEPLMSEKKPLLVGELNPYGTDPSYALFPLPEYASGGRLAKIFGLRRTEYLQKFDRVNLCTGTWSMPEAKKAAAMLLVNEKRPLVLLGKKVATAFGYPHAGSFNKLDNLVFLPHPSGLNRLWNEPGAIPRVRELMAPFLRLVP